MVWGPPVDGRRSEMSGALGEIDHVSRGMRCQRMMRKAWPRRDVLRHLTNNLDLPVRALGQQSDHQILQSDHANPKLHQLGIGQIGLAVRLCG